MYAASPLRVYPTRPPTLSSSRHHAPTRSPTHSPTGDRHPDRYFRCDGVRIERRAVRLHCFEGRWPRGPTPWCSGHASPPLHHPTTPPPRQFTPSPVRHSRLITTVPPRYFTARPITDHLASLPPGTPIHSPTCPLTHSALPPHHRGGSCRMRRAISSIR